MSKNKNKTTNKCDGIKFLRLLEVIEKTGLSKSTIYDKIKENKFPKQIKLTEGAVAWLEEDVVTWMLERIAESNIREAQLIT